MKDAKHGESREKFQFERLIFFSDAVIAIAITLLVIEIKVPVLNVFKDEALLENLSETPFKLFGFLISFGIIGHYWSVHHRIFGYIQKYTTLLFWINLAFLFSIVLLPFSSGLMGEYSRHTNMHIPYLIYVINIFFCGLMNAWIWLYVSGHKRNLLTHLISGSRIRLGLYRIAVVPCGFLISFFVSYYYPVISRFMLILIPFILHWGMNRLEKKADLQEDKSEAFEEEGIF